MPELRVDQLSGRWVLVAPERASRPHAHPTPPNAPATPPADCPFCPGHEHLTPPEVARTGTGGPDTPGWRVRVVPNLYAAVGGDDAGDGATGAHEIVVFSPAHERSFGLLRDEEAVEVFAMLRDRMRAHYEAGRLYVQAIVNQGRAAGASIEHPHAQLVALDVVPPLVAARLQRFAQAAHDLVAVELAHVVHGDLEVVTGPAPVWCPWAASTPFEMRVAHRSTRARFDEAADVELAGVALATRDALARLHGVADNAPYNVVFHTAPPGPAPFFHWYVEILPRLSIVAGFEQGTGIYVNTLPAERAARTLREVAP